MEKTIKDAMLYVIDNLKREKGISSTMSAMMLESVLVNMENGKSLDDTIDF